MFWKFGFHSHNAIDGILDRESFTLEELLDEDDLLQETRGNHKRLIDFICRPENLHRLIDYVTIPPDESMDPRQQFKYPSIAAEVLSSDIWPLIEGITTSQILMDALFSFLARPAPLNPLLASFFSKVASMLIMKQTSETLQYIRHIPNVMDKFIMHIDVSAIKDLLVKIVAQPDPQQKDFVISWLNEEKFVERLISLIDSKYSEDVQANGASTFIDIIQACLDPEHLLPPLEIVDQLHTPEVLNKLLDQMFADPTSPMIHGLSLILVILDHKREIPRPTEEGRTGSPVSLEQQQMETPNVLHPEKILNVLIERLEAFHKVLSFSSEGKSGIEEGNKGSSSNISSSDSNSGKNDDNNDNNSNSNSDNNNNSNNSNDSNSNSNSNSNIDNSGSNKSDSNENEKKGDDENVFDASKKSLTLTSGTLAPPLGSVRLKVVRLFSAIFRSDSEAAYAKIVDLNILGTVLDLFFHYKWNNFLHLLVDDIFSSIFSHYAVTADKTQFITMVKNSNLIERIIKGFENSQIENSIVKNGRSGYIGHLTRIANIVAEAQKEDSADFLGDKQTEWKTFTETALEAINRVNQITLGGHRPTTMEESDEEMFDNQDEEEQQTREFEHYLSQRTLGGDAMNEFSMDDDDDDNEDGHRPFHSNDMFASSAMFEAQSHNPLHAHLQNGRREDDDDDDDDEDDDDEDEEDDDDNDVDDDDDEDDDDDDDDKGRHHNPLREGHDISSGDNKTGDDEENDGTGDASALPMRARSVPIQTENQDASESNWADFKESNVSQSSSDQNEALESEKPEAQNSEVEAVIHQEILDGKFVGLQIEPVGESSTDDNAAAAEESKDEPLFSVDMQVTVDSAPPQGNINADEEVDTSEC